MQPTDTKPIKSSPTTKPCTHIVSNGTADTFSPSTTIKSPDNETPTVTVTVGPVPLYLIPQKISSEIRTHGGDISAITIRRTGQHGYEIACTIPSSHRQNRKPGGGDAD